ncbi:MAG: hypothetical protein ACYCWW_00585, partial [Deltaproteobacteria bacterium]
MPQIREAERLSAILEIGRALGSTLDLDLLLRLVVAHGSRLLDADRCTVFVHDEERHELWSKVAQGLGEEAGSARRRAEAEGPEHSTEEAGSARRRAEAEGNQNERLIRISEKRGLVGAAFALGRPV